MTVRLSNKGLMALAAVLVVSACTPLLVIRSYEPDMPNAVAVQPSILQHSIPLENLVQIPVDCVEDPVDNYVENSTYTDEDLEILAIIIYQEAGGDMCSDDTRRKVGSVFLNRVNSPMFPDTFEEVATQEKQYGTLYWTGIKWPDRATNEYEAHAVERAYNIAEDLLVNGTDLPENVIWQAEFAQGDGIYCYQDNFYFCYTEEN